MSFIPLLQSSGPGQYLFLVTIFIIFFIFYFLIIRPQKKEQKKLEAMIASLQKGDKIITVGGIHGVVSSTKERTVILKIDEGCKIEINRTAVGVVLRDEKKNGANNIAEEKKMPFFGRKKSEKTSETAEEE